MPAGVSDLKLERCPSRRSEKMRPSVLEIVHRGDRRRVLAAGRSFSQPGDLSFPSPRKIREKMFVGESFGFPSPRRKIRKLHQKILAVPPNHGHLPPPHKRLEDRVTRRRGNVTTSRVKKILAEMRLPEPPRGGGGKKTDQVSIRVVYRSLPMLLIQGSKTARTWQ